MQRYIEGGAQFFPAIETLASKLTLRRNKYWNMEVGRQMEGGPQRAERRSAGNSYRAQ